MEMTQVKIHQPSQTKTGEYDLYCNIDKNELSYPLTIKDFELIDYSKLLYKLKILKETEFDNNHDIKTSFSNDGYYDLVSTYLNEAFTLLNNKLKSSYTSITYLVETPEKKEENLRLSKFSKAFENELQKYKHYISTDKEEATSLFYTIVEQVVKINFNDFIVEIAPSNSFKIKLRLPDKTLLVITKPFHNMEDLAINEVVFSIFENKKCLISDAIDIIDLVNGINDHLATK